MLLSFHGPKPEEYKLHNSITVHLQINLACFPWKMHCLGHPRLHHAGQSNLGPVIPQSMLHGYLLNTFIGPKPNNYNCYNIYRDPLI